MTVSKFNKNAQNKKVKYRFFINMLLMLLVLGSCNSNRHDIDVSDVHVDLQWKRLDSDLMMFEHADFDTVNHTLNKEYGEFYRRYIQNVLRLGMVNDPGLSYQMEDFIHNPDIQGIFTEVGKTFPDVEKQRLALNEAFRYYKHYFPKRQIPTLVSFVSLFSYNVAATDSILGIGLDMYLGAGNKLYKMAALPMYQQAKSDRAYLPFDAMRGWILSEFEQDAMRQDLLPVIIDYGKAMYLMDTMFPFAEDYLKIGYTPEQIAWCKDYEGYVWTIMVEKKMLFSTDREIIRALTGPGPFSSGFPQESPGQLGYWVGWQIIRSFMDENRDVTPAQLMEMNDAREILKKSGYKPKA